MTDIALRLAPALFASKAQHLRHRRRGKGASAAWGYKLLIWAFRHS
jgi:hypothetical protein